MLEPGYTSVPSGDLARVAQLSPGAAAHWTGAPTRNRGRTSDAELATLIQQRDVTALELLYDRHAGVALGLARRIVADRVLAEDVTQEAFLSVWRSSHLYRPERGSVRAWVLGITHHRAIDAVRRRATQARVKAAEQNRVERLPAGDLTEAAVISRDDTRTTRDALQTLSGDQRRAIELAYFAGLSHTEIAAKLDVPLGTVKGRIRLGLEKLRAVLGPVGVGA